MLSCNTFFYVDFDTDDDLKVRPPVQYLTVANKSAERINPSLKWIDLLPEENVGSNDANVNPDMLVDTDDQLKIRPPIQYITVANQSTETINPSLKWIDRLPEENLGSNDANVSPDMDEFSAFENGISNIDLNVDMPDPVKDTSDEEIILYFLDQIDKEGDYNKNSNVLPFERSKTCLWGKLTRGYSDEHKVYAQQFKKLYKSGKPGKERKKIQDQIIRHIIHHCESLGYTFRYLATGQNEANAVVVGVEHPKMIEGLQRILTRK